MTIIGRPRHEILQEIAIRLGHDPAAPHTWPSIIQRILWDMEEAADRALAAALKEALCA